MIYQLIQQACHIHQCLFLRHTLTHPFCNIQYYLVHQLHHGAILPTIITVVTRQCNNLCHHQSLALQLLLVCKPFMSSLQQATLVLAVGVYRNKYGKPAIPPDDICLLTEEWRQFTPVGSQIPQCHWSNTYYHLHAVFVPNGQHLIPKFKWQQSRRLQHNSKILTGRKSTRSLEFVLAFSYTLLCTLTVFNLVLYITHYFVYFEHILWHF